MSILVAVIAILFLAIPLHADDQIPVKVLTDIKDATVFVKVKAGRLEMSGSGFLMQTDGETGLIVTNHHVVTPPARLNLPAPTVEVVFNSGRKNELVLKADVVAADSDRDLAILRIKSKDLPKPIDRTEKVELVETMGVYIFGFPFGEALSTTKGNPAITIGKGSVSSIREDEYGETKVVQIDGDLNPGNSGGPVVDSKGRLVGVAVAHIRNTRIGLAIPPIHLTRMLHGRVSEYGIRPVKVTEAGAELELEMLFIDPLNKISKAAVRVLPSDALKEPLKADKEGKWPELPGAELFEFTVENQKGKVTIQVSSKGKSATSYLIQPVFTNGEKVVVNTQPGKPYAVDFAHATAGNTAPNSPLAGITEFGKPKEIGDLKVSALKIGDKEAPACLCWSADAKAFYHLDGVGTVRRMSFPDVKEQAVQATGKKCNWLNVSAEGVVLTVAESKELWLLDAKTLEVKSKIGIDNAKRVVSAPGTSRAYAATPDRAILNVIDLKAGKATKQFDNSNYNLKGGVGFDHAVMTPDGKYLFSTGGSGQIYRYALDGDEVKFEDRSDGLISGRFDGLSMSVDGKFICAPTGGGNPSREGQQWGPYVTAVFSTKNLTTPLTALKSGAYPLAVGFDAKTGLIFAQNFQQQMILFDAQGTKVREYKLGGANSRGTTRQFLVHPDGGKLIVLGERDTEADPPKMWLVELPPK
jgi:S1-C subfamily serine protease